MFHKTYLRLYKYLLIVLVVLVIVSINLDLPIFHLGR